MKVNLAAHVPSTEQFPFLYGIYDRSEFKVPYLSLTMSFQEAADSLHLASELPGAEDIEWEVEELYQRDIDWAKVRDKIVPYLNNDKAPNFFNSITVAALPLDDTGQGLLEDFSDAADWKAPPLENPEQFAKTLSIGPVSLGYWQDFESPSDPGAQLGAVRWNPNQLFGVAIDGQHRLAAIKMLIDQRRNDPKHQSTRVPVLILLFDPRLGYAAPEGTRNVEAIRRLFIDLNKHATPVSRARQILLDDREPHAIAIRSMIGAKLGAGVDDLDESPPRLPLALVDWFSGQAKFESGPFVTTVLTLDWIVARALNTDPISDYTAYSKISQQVGRLETNLGLDLSGAKQRIAELATVKLSPFEYTALELAAVRHAFSSIWSDPLIHALSEFAPYSALIQRREDSGALSLEFQDWYRLFTKGYTDTTGGRDREDYLQLLGRLKQPAEGRGPLLEDKLLSCLAGIDELKRSNGLAFAVVFQKAFFDAMIDFCKLPSGMFDDFESAGWDDDFEFDDSDGDFFEDGGDEDSTDFGAVGAIPGSGSASAAQPEASADDDDIAGVPLSDVLNLLSAQHGELRERFGSRSRDFVDIMNRLIAAWPEFLQLAAPMSHDDGAGSSFWQGTLRKAEGEIDFTQSAASRAKTLILMCACLVKYHDLSPIPEEEDFDELWSLALSGEGPALAKRLGVYVKGFSLSGDNPAAARILAGRGEDFDEDLAREEARTRLYEVWASIPE